MIDNYPKIKKLIKNTPHRFIQASTDSLVVRFEKNNLKEVTSKQNSSYQLEVINQQKIGTAASNFFDPKNLATKALVSSQFGEKVGYKLPKQTPLPKVKLYSAKVASLKPQDFIKLGEQIIDGIRTADPNILVDVRISKITANSQLNTSAGFSNHQRETEMSISAEGELVSKGDILTIGDYWGWRDQDFKLKEFVKSIVDKFIESKKMTKVLSGQYTVLLTPEVLANLVEFYQTALSAQIVSKKTSKWTDQMGQQVADPRIMLTDDPNVDFAADSTDCDDEGLAAKPLVLIDQGVLKSFYTDLKYAEKLKIEPNGRGFGIPASPGLTNLVFKPGSKPLKKIISEIKNGILVEQVIGGGQDSPYSGDFSVNIHLGFLIKNGKIVGRIKNCLMSGNAFEMFKDQLGEISQESPWYGGSLSIPYMTFNKITVASET